MGAIAGDSLDAPAPDEEPASGVRPALQERSRRTRDAILKAVEGALDKGALDVATVHDLAAAAGVSIGAFYGRFENKDAAIAALYHERRSQFISKLTSLNARASSLDIWTEQAVAIAMDYAATNRSLIARAARPDAVIDGVKKAARTDSLALAEDLASALGRLAPAIPKNTLPEVAAFTIAMLGGMTRDAAVFSASLLGGKTTRPWFEQTLAGAIKSFVLSKSVGAAQSD